MEKLQRRVAGYHDIRLDGITDLLLRARGASVMDIGCNRGLVGFEFAQNGATRVHGCDIYGDGINCARQIFCDLRSIESQFEIVDLTQGAGALKPFGANRYDTIVMLATYHKLKRNMAQSTLSELMVELGNRTIRYFGWRGTSEKQIENDNEIQIIDRDLVGCGLRKIHTSYISRELGVACIWERK